MYRHNEIPEKDAKCDLQKRTGKKMIHRSSGLNSKENIYSRKIDLAILYLI
jgi:hypothetical protein